MPPGFLQTVAVDPPFQGEFEGFKATKYPDEQKGNIAWMGGTLPYVAITSGETFLHPPLEQSVLDLILKSWTSAQAPVSAPRNPRLMAGQHRGPAGPGTYKPVAPIDYDRKGKVINDQSSHLRQVFPRDWSLLRDIPRVSAYAFRGDGRPPAAIRAAGGFSPPISRTDDHYVKNTMFPIFQQYLKEKTGANIQLPAFEGIVRRALPNPADRMAVAYYAIWWTQVQRESMHLGRMLANEDLKGYVSTTKATSVAKGFADQAGGGYIYLVRVRSGFHVPSKGQHTWTTLFGEEEIAVPVPIPWEDVMGWRAYIKNTSFTGPVVLRSQLRMDSQAWPVLYDLLSGKPQN